MKYYYTSHPSTDNYHFASDEQMFVDYLLTSAPEKRIDWLRYRRMLAVAAWNNCYVTDPYVIRKLLAQERLPARYEHLRDEIEVEGRPSAWMSNLQRRACLPWTPDTIRQDIRNARAWFAEHEPERGFTLGNPTDLLHFDDLDGDASQDAEKDLDDAVSDLSLILCCADGDPAAQQHAASIIRRAASEIADENQAVAELLMAQNSQP